MTGKEIINKFFKTGQKKSQQGFDPFNLSRTDKKKRNEILVSLDLRTAALTKKDVEMWRNACQMAINIENPKRNLLYDIYADVAIDLHLTGAISQRQNMVLKKGFKLVDKSGKENEVLTALFEAEWFKDFWKHALDSRFYGYSLIQLGETITGETMKFANATLIPRKHVVQEYGVIIKNEIDDPTQGTSYLEGDYAKWVIGVGRPNDLGLLLNCCPEAISKKNMLAYWSAFGEIFGMPIRIATTTSRDKDEIDGIKQEMIELGAAASAVVPEGTTITFQETSRGDAYNVYDKRIDRANSEMSKGILNQTMTIDSGSSLSQSEVHLEIFENVIEADADFFKDVVNNKLLPFMVMRGFPVAGHSFVWDDSVDYTPEQQIEIEKMLLTHRYIIPPQHFTDKYGIPIEGREEGSFFD